MLKTMLSIQIPKDIIPEELKLEFEDLSKVNNKYEYADSSHRYYDSETEALYIMNKYEDGFYNDYLLKEDAEGAAEHFFNKLQLDTSLQEVIRKSRETLVNVQSVVGFTLFTDITFCVGYNLSIDNPDFSNGYDLSYNWDEICDSGIVEASLKATDQLGRYREVFNEPYLSDTGRDIIGDKICEAPYHGVIPECVDINDVIAELHIDLNAPYMIDTYERDMAQREDFYER